MTVTIENTYTGNNSKKIYPFTFPYLDQTDVKVSLDGVELTNSQLFTKGTTSITFKNDTGSATTTQLADGSPKTGVAVRLYRSTAYNSPKATFYPGSAIRAGDLNDNSLQNLYVTQEANNDIGLAWKSGDTTVNSSETWYTTDDTKIATTKSIESRIDDKIDTAIEGDVLAGTDLTKTQTGGQVTINHSVSGAASVDNSNGTVIQDLTINGRGHVTATGSVDLDGRYYTETEIDANFYKIGSANEIRSDETWSASNTKIATTSAIDARITDMIDDVGGFVPIANETSFPNANPDINDGTGTLVSIKALSSNLTSNGSGVATISNGTVGNSTVTITGLANSTTYASTYGMIVETTTTLNTYTFHRQVPKATEVTTVAGSISNVNTVATNIAAINTTNSNISAITTVNSNTNNINAVAGQILFSEDLGAITDSLSTGSGNDINTVATNLTSVSSFANIYRIASSAPSSSLDEGDLWYDSTANVLKIYNGTSWVVTASSGLGNTVEDTTPELGGHLDCNDKNLTEVGTVSGDNLQIDFGTLS